MLKKELVSLWDQRGVPLHEALTAFPMWLWRLSLLFPIDSEPLGSALHD